MQQRRIFGIVLENLSKPANSNPKKTIGEVLLDGSYTPFDLTSQSISDLVKICDSTQFPPNPENEDNLPEGSYSTSDAMEEFVNILSPYLSDKELFRLTHELTRLEMTQDTQAFRTSRILKPFMRCEFQRHAAHTPERKLPATFLLHFKEFVLPLCQQYWPKKIEENVNRFACFNILGGLGDFSQINGYEQMLAVTAEEVANLSTQTCKDKSEFPAELASLKKEYALQLSKQNLAKFVETPSPELSSDSEAYQVSPPKEFKVSSESARHLVTLREYHAAWIMERTLLNRKIDELAEQHAGEVNKGNDQSALDLNNTIKALQNRIEKLDKAIGSVDQKLQSVDSALAPSQKKL